MKRVTKQFVLAGNATFTVRMPSGAHRTYKVLHPENKPFFVFLLTGPDNTSDYKYLGLLVPETGVMVSTKKSCADRESFVARLLNRILAKIWIEDHAAYEEHGFTTHYEGRCGRCGRKLTTPESVEQGFGPECILHV